MLYYAKKAVKNFSVILLLSVKINADTEGIKAEFILSNYLCYAMQKMSVEILENFIYITYMHIYTPIEKCTSCFFRVNTITTPFSTVKRG